MTEIKVGDKVSVSGWAFCLDGDIEYFDNKRAIVREQSAIPRGYVIQKNSITVSIIPPCKTEYECNIYMVHRKQCRKLVKMHTCYACNGDGTVMIDPLGNIASNRVAANNSTMSFASMACPVCNGKGKIPQ